MIFFILLAFGFYFSEVARAMLLVRRIDRDNSPQANPLMARRWRLSMSTQP